MAEERRSWRACGCGSRAYLYRWGWQCNGCGLVASRLGGSGEEHVNVGEPPGGDNT